MGEWLFYKPGLRIQVFGMTRGHCFYCGHQLDNNWQVDHLVPRSRAGRDDSLANLAPACCACNSRKGARSLEEFRVREQARLRCERYVFHFETLDLRVPEAAYG